MAFKKNQSALGKEVAPIAILVTGPMTRSKSKALAQQDFELQPVITLDFLRKDVAKKSLSVGEICILEISLPVLTRMNSQVMTHIQTLHLVIQGKMCPMDLAIPLDPQLLSVCLLS